MEYPPVPDTDLTTALIISGVCPRCLGTLDTNWECMKCKYDAYNCMVEKMEELQ